MSKRAAAGGLFVVMLVCGISGAYFDDAWWFPMNERGNGLQFFSGAVIGFLVIGWPIFGWTLVND